MKDFLKYKILLLLIPLMFLQACGNRYAEEVQKQHKIVTQKTDVLKQKLDGNGLTNAVLARTYADTLAEDQPALKPVALALKKDATSSGGMYVNFRNRLAAVNINPEKEYDYRQAVEELNNIAVGSDPAIYNDALLDIVNTLADLSKGKLARINVPKSEAASNIKDGQGVVPGSYLVGNPNYGSFKTDSSGKSVWEWYGQYAMFRDIMSIGDSGYYRRGPIYADEWYSRPRYSYYNDYGRGSYGSYKARSSWQSTQTYLKKHKVTPAKPKKDFRSTAGKKRQSAFLAQRQANKVQYGSKVKPQAPRAPPNSGGNSQTKRTSAWSNFKPSNRGTTGGTRSFRSGK